MKSEQTPATGSPGRTAPGRHSRRQDEVGTPFCLTYDFDSPEDGAVTVRERDTMAQERIPLEGVERYLAERLVGC